MNQILIVKEKYSTRYFDASTSELKNKAAFKILKERFDDGWYDVGGEPYDLSILTDYQISQLPNEALKTSETERRKMFQKKLNRWQGEKEEYDLIKDAVENNRVQNAYFLLEGRSDGEYEGILIKTLENNE